jgi:hypothetical protein
VGERRGEEREMRRWKEGEKEGEGKKKRGEGREEREEGGERREEREREKERDLFEHVRVQLVLVQSK